jgi:hypothetical protein
MRLNERGGACRLLKLADGTEILFSFSIPVAGFDPLNGYFKGDTAYSVTTTKHIAGYVGTNTTVKTVTQKHIDTLLSRSPNG